MYIMKLTPASQAFIQALTGTFLGFSSDDQFVIVEPGEVPRVVSARTAQMLMGRHQMSGAQFTIYS